MLTAMLRIFTFLCILFFTNSSIHAQQDSFNATPLRHITFLELGFQHAGVNFQRVAGKRLVVDLAAGLGSSYVISEGSVASNWNLFSPAAQLSVTPRLYYNRERRARKGRNGALNAGNYVGMRLKYATGKLNGADEGAVLTNVHWGLQRALGKRWIFNTHAGLGWATQMEYGETNTIYPTIDLKFSYALFEKQLGR